MIDGPFGYDEVIRRIREGRQAGGDQPMFRRPTFRTGMVVCYDPEWNGVYRCAFEKGGVSVIGAYCPDIYDMTAVDWVEV